MLNSVRCRHLVLLIGLASTLFTVSTTTRVCPYNHPNCTCRGSQSLECTGLSQLPPLLTVNVLHMSKVILKGGQITTISRNSLPPNVDHLTVQSNPLTNISDDAFARSETLNSLHIEEASFHTLPQALLQLVGLVKLTIIKTPIQTWNTALLQHISRSLTSISLQEVGLAAWPSWFSYLALLRIVDLSSNCLTSVPDNAFTSLTGRLTSLTLRNTCLTHVPNVIFSLSYLTSLDLSHNNLTNMTQATTSSLPASLTFLNLTSVGMTQATNFSHLRHLVALSLSGNTISDVSQGFLPLSLRFLFLASASLTSVPPVATLTVLSWLNIQNNQITTIQPNSFPSNLTYLALKNNRLTTITDTTFGNLHYLFHLDLEGNAISTISPSSFSHLTSLKILYRDSANPTDNPQALVSVSNSQTYVVLNSAQPWACLCPPDAALVRWFTTLPHAHALTGNCRNGQLARTYLRDQCG